MALKSLATTAVTLALTLAATTTSCGIGDPYDDDLPDPPPWDSPSLNLDSEISDTSPTRPGRSPVDPAPSPAAAIERFATLYTNWDYRTLARTQRQLAAMSVGEAATTHARAAARTHRDYELRRGRVANRGQIVSLSPSRPPARRGYVVVTLERTTGARVYDDLRPAYHVTFATTQAVHGGWAVSRWEPKT